MLPSNSRMAASKAAGVIAPGLEIAREIVRNYLTESIHRREK